MTESDKGIRDINEDSKDSTYQLKEMIDINTSIVRGQKLNEDIVLKVSFDGTTIIYNEHSRQQDFCYL